MTTTTGKKKLLDRFFAKIVSGGLILRLLVVLVALTVGLLLSIAAMAVFQAEIHWADLAIAFGLMAVAFSVAQYIEGIAVDPSLVLARLSATTAVRIGLPLAGIVLLDRVVKPGFLDNTLVFWLVGFLLGMTTSSLIAWGRLTHSA